MDKGNQIVEKSYYFAIRIVKMTKLLTARRTEDVLTRQILKSGTAVGALISEAVFAQSKADFINKYSIALKEANETNIGWIYFTIQKSFLKRICVYLSRLRRVGKNTCSHFEYSKSL